MVKNLSFAINDLLNKLLNCFDGDIRSVGLELGHTVFFQVDKSICGTISDFCVKEFQNTDMVLHIDIDINKKSLRQTKQTGLHSPNTNNDLTNVHNQ